MMLNSKHNLVYPNGEFWLCHYLLVDFSEPLLP